MIQQQMEPPTLTDANVNTATATTQAPPALPQEMINKILYEYKGLQTPSASAMQVLIDQVKTDMDNFKGVGINYILIVMSETYGGNGSDSMWCYYLMGWMMEGYSDDKPECLPWFNLNVFRTGDTFPDQFVEACGNYEDLPDDPKEIKYEERYVFPSFSKSSRDPTFGLWC